MLPGQLPRSIDRILEGDLCDRCKPGDRVRVSTAPPEQGQLVGMFRTLLLANALRGLTAELRTTPSRARTSRTSAPSPAPRTPASSPCPRALHLRRPREGRPLLMLLGGSEKNLANGTHLRGT